MVPELRSLATTASDDRTVPADISDCRVSVTAAIGPGAEVGEELFHFDVVTPKYLARSGELPRWGAGTLIVDEFSWQEVERMLLRLLARVEAASWQDVVTVLRKQLEWEFEGYSAPNTEGQKSGRRGR